MTFRFVTEKTHFACKLLTDFAWKVWPGGTCFLLRAPNFH